MRAAIVVLAAVLIWLLLGKKSQATPLPSADPDEGNANPLPSQPVQPGSGDNVQAYDQSTITAHDQNGNVILFFPDGTSVNEAYGGEQPLAPARPN